MKHFRPVATVHKDIQSIAKYFPTSVDGGEVDTIVQAYLNGRLVAEPVVDADEESYIMDDEVKAHPRFHLTSDGQYGVYLTQGDSGLLKSGSCHHGYFMDIFEAFEEDKRFRGVDAQTRLYDFYKRAYPSDTDMHEEINRNATFQDAFECLQVGFNFYAFLGVSDSTVRERIFDALAVLMGCTYEHIYHQWLDHSKEPLGSRVLTYMGGLRFKNEEE